MCEAADLVAGAVVAAAKEIETEIVMAVVQVEAAAAVAVGRGVASEVVALAEATVVKNETIKTEQIMREQHADGFTFQKVKMTSM